MFYFKGDAMKIKVFEIRLGLNESEEKLPSKAAGILGIKEENIITWKIDKKGVDARRKNNVQFIYNIVIWTNLEEYLAFLDKNPKARAFKEEEKENFFCSFGKGQKTLQYGPVIIGSGPAGLFCALALALYGYKPLVLERGKKIDSRKQDVVKFWETGELNTESNVQYGEGGAGTFSDGKLTTRIKDTAVKFIIDSFIEAGAPEEIAYLNKPHLGTDRLQTIVENLRNKIIQAGGKVLFQTCLTDIFLEKRKVSELEINSRYSLPTECVILAVGHSARDTYRMLNENSVQMKAKPFAVGLRIEHPQNIIDKAQYGKFARYPSLGPADYRLTYKSREYGRSAYTFCMCPGGYVIGASSEKGYLVVNGMSNYNRDSGTANSAVVVTVGEGDFSISNPLSGIEFQRKLERTAYNLAGGNFAAPVQSVFDFIEGGKGKDLPEHFTYKPRAVPSDLRRCLPEDVGFVLAEALRYWDKKIKGFAGREGVLTGVESRTSAPLWILRKENMEALNTSGIYPVGEGAGYAGGIISSALEGIKAARSVIEKYGPPREGFPKEIKDLEGEEI